MWCSKYSDIELFISFGFIWSFLILLRLVLLTYQYYFSVAGSSFWHPFKFTSLMKISMKLSLSHLHRNCLFFSIILVFKLRKIILKTRTVDNYVRMWCICIYCIDCSKCKKCIIEFDMKFIVQIKEESAKIKVKFPWI